MKDNMVQLGFMSCVFKCSPNTRYQLAVLSCENIASKVWNLSLLCSYFFQSLA